MYRNLLLTLFLCTSVVVATPISLLDALQDLSTPNSSLYDSSVANDIQSHNLTVPDLPEFRKWQISGTPTFLRIMVFPRLVIPPLDLNDVILDTNQTLFNAIRRGYITKDQPLNPEDDPYRSAPQWAKSFITIRSDHLGNPHLTYGVIADILRGLWEYLCQGNRPREAAFEVHDDVRGILGVGRVTRRPPNTGMASVAEA